MIPILFFLLIFIPSYPMNQDSADRLLNAYTEYVKTHNGTDFGLFIEWVSNGETR